MKASIEFPNPVNVQLVYRILDLITEDSRKQSGKKLEINNLSNAIFEFGRSQKLTPPFNDLRSPQEISEALGFAKTLFDKTWSDVGEINKTLELLIESKLVFQIELDPNQYLEPKKLLVLPTGLLMYRKLSDTPNKETVALEDFEGWIHECHQEHSNLALKAFEAGIKKTIRQSQKLSPFNISLSLYLLMYGAINSNHALRFEVDPTKNISEYQGIISDEIRRIGQQVVGVDPVGTQTLLDHFQTSNKIKRILSNSDLYDRKKNDLPNNRTQYRIYFNLGTKSINHPDITTRLDDLLRAIIPVAKNRRDDADEKIIELLSEHTHEFNRSVDPIYTKVLFGQVPSFHYVSKIRGRAETVVQSLVSGEYTVNDDEDEDVEYLEL